MGTANKVVVIHREDWVTGAQELGVEDNLDTVGGVVEELATADLVQDRIFLVVDHVVGNNRRQVGSLHGEKTTAKQNLVFCCQEASLIRRVLALVPCQRALKELLANVLFNGADSVVQRLEDGLTLEGLDGERGGLCGHNDESDDGHVGTSGLETVVETGQRLDEHVDTLIAVLVTTCGEEVQGLVGVEIVVAIEVTTDKVVDSLLVYLMQVLELVGCRELLDVQTVGQDTIRLALEQMFTLVSSDMRYGCEDICGVSSTAFYAVAMVNASLSGLGVAVKVLQVVVEVDRAGAEITTEEGCVGGEDGGHVNSALLAQRKSNTGEPLVELSNDCALLFVVDVLVMR